MIEVVDGLDLSGVPVPFLEAYPFPAFVLAIPVTSRAARPRSVHRDTDITVRHYNDDISPSTGPPLRGLSAITIAWGNERWLQITAGRRMEDLFDPATQSKLQAWIEDNDEEDAVFPLEIKDPSITLYSSKTTLPFTPPSTTHAFCIVTSQTCSRPRPSTTPSDRPSPGLRSSASSERHSSASYWHERTSTTPTDTRSSMSTDTSRQSSAESYFSLADRGSMAPSERSSSSGRTRVRMKPGKGPQISIQNMLSAAEEHWASLESFDWSKTKLGPTERWVEAIGPLLSVTFQSKTMDSIWLGDDLQLIYNKTYSQSVEHPKSFGMPAKQVWASIWDYIGPLTESVSNGTPIYKEDDSIIYRKYAVVHDLETYFSWRYVPIATRDGKIIGFFNQATESTEKVSADRRLATIRELSEQMLIARTMREYYDSVADVFDQNPYDAPFVMCYSVTTKATTPIGVDVEAKSECTVGVPETHRSRQEKISSQIPMKNKSQFGPNADRLSSPTLSAISASSSGSGRHYLTASGVSWPIQKASSTRQAVIVEDCRDLIQGFPIRAWEESPFAAAVVPICSDNSADLPEAVMIIGLNVRRPLDAEYDGWLHVIRSQLASSFLSVKAYEAEQKRLDDTLRMEKAKSAWFRGAAHDSRSPSTLVNGPLEDLSGTELTKSQRRQLSTAKRNVDRSLRLVNTLLDFSRLEAGRVEAKFVPVNSGMWVGDLAELFRVAVERAGMTFEVEIEPYDQAVYIDPSSFETVVSNSIGNALKYTKSGSIIVRVTFDEHADIAVIDTGVGIPADEIEHVTDWYHRASTAIHTGTQGTGLGLAVAREVSRLHEGDLIVKSQTADESGGPHGSTFIARIPLVQRTPVDVPENVAFGEYGKAVAEEAMRWAGASSTEASSDVGEESRTTSASGSGSRLSDASSFEKGDTLLVVDDNLEMRAYIRGIFKRYCTVLEAGNGEEALEIVKTQNPNLVLCDMMMPKVNGSEFSKAIRHDVGTRLIPVVSLSAMQGDDARVDSLIMGAEDFLEKPFKPKELSARVHSHMQVGKKRAQLEKAFNERETQIAVLSDYCPSGIMRADALGTVTYANDAWRKMAGMAKDVDPSLWPRYATPETVASSLRPWNEWLVGTQRELKSQWKWLTGVSVEGLFIRLDSVDPKSSGILGCISDITYQEQRVLDAQERQREAEESRQQQESLIDLTSHEIRTPVSAILQCSSLVKENLVSLKEQSKWAGEGGFRPSPESSSDSEDDVEASESIYQCGSVQERIAGDVSSSARIQLDMSSLYDVEMDLRKEAKKIVSVFTSEARMKKIESVLKFGPSIEQARVTGIKTDPVRLGQVITNSISNAIRFTASSNVRQITTTYDVSFVPPAEDTCASPPSIELPSVVPPPEDTPMWLFVSVRDTGPGSGPKELAMLFKRFSQGNKMIHTRYGGSGLGSFICRKITEMLGGRIEVQSQLGEGSVFRFFIKTRAIHPPSPIAAMVETTSAMTIDMSRNSSPSGAATPSSATSSQSMGSMADDDWSDHHILIVEDNIINQTVLKRQLVKAGSTCDVANNGSEALNSIRETERQARRGGGSNRKKRYNAVSMDSEMPVMDGSTAVREIRAAEAAGTLSRHMVIALTGNARQGQIDQALEAGMDDVIIKPYVSKNSLHKIRAMSSKRAELEQEQDAFGVRM